MLYKSYDKILPLPSEISLELSEKISDLVRNKYLLDKAVAEHGATMLAGELYDGGYGPHEPGSFFHLVFPFVQNSAPVGDDFFALAPTSHTLGCSWRWTKRSLSEAQTYSAERAVQDVDGLLAGTIDRVSYQWIRSLGIIIPVEGKNRVDFSRESGFCYIPAKISERDYPAAERIKIYSVDFCNAEEYWAVLDDRWVQRICYPTWALPVLFAYGVESGKKWPLIFPSPSKIALAFNCSPNTMNSPRGHPDFESLPIVDIYTIQAIEKYAEEIVCCSIYDIKGVFFTPKTIFWVLSLTLSMMIVSLVCFPYFPEVSMFLFMVFGMGFGVSWVTTAKIFKTKRKYLKRRYFLPHELAPKAQYTRLNKYLG